MMNKLFMLEDSQIKKWGKFNGRVSLLFGICLLCYSPYFYFSYNGKLSAYAKKLSDQISQYDQALSQTLFDVLVAIDHALIYLVLLFLGASILWISSGLMYLRLYNVIKNKA